MWRERSRKKRKRAERPFRMRFAFAYTPYKKAPGFLSNECYIHCCRSSIEIHCAVLLYVKSERRYEQTQALSKQASIRAYHLIHKRPSAFINAFFISSKSIVPTTGGTAFPICFFTPVPLNFWPNGNDCRHANSRWV